MRRAANRPGFTLLELLCVLGMLATLLAIAIPRVSAHLPGMRLDHAARVVAAEVRLARVRAITRNARVRFAAHLDLARWTVETDAGGNFVAEGGPRPLPDGVRFDRAGSSRIAGDRVSITFQPRGHTADNSTIALLASDGSRRRIVINQAGRVRIE